MRWLAEDDHADPPVLGTREKEIGFEGIDLAVGDDHEQRHMPVERVFRPLGGLGKNGL